MFEVCMTMNDTWGYKKDDTNWKSVQRLVQMLSDISSKGGNFLLNIGPMADGTIPPESIDRLQAVGRWMDVNAEAIHGTRSSPFPRRLPWGRVTQKAAENGGTTLYLHVWDWPADGRILLPTLQELPDSGKLLKGDATVTAERVDDGVIVQLPGSATDPDVSVVRLDFKDQPTITQLAYVTAASDGTITLTATDADTHGGYAGNILVEGSGADAYLTDWKLPALRVSYQVMAEKAGQWRVEADVAAPEASKLHIGVAKDTVPVAIPATGSGMAWKTVTLGEIKLPAGESTLELKPERKAWKPIHLRKLRMTPVSK
jgi:alpha-L-fucosidase